VGELVIPETDHHVCSAAHFGMHGAACEEEAEGRVMWVCWYAPDDVARIDVLDAYFRASGLRVVPNRVAQKSSDVCVLDVSRRVAVRRFLGALGAHLPRQRSLHGLSVPAVALIQLGNSRV
jgi:hypothetical protein